MHSGPGGSGEAGATWALLVAAGAGERLGLDRPKAFASLGGRPLLAEELAATKVVSCVTGGATRADSVRRALDDVPDDALVVLVHDAARPLVDDAVVERVLAPLAEGFDGVVPALPIPDTVKRVDDGVVVETVDRDGLVGAQTPQAFLAAVLRRALRGDLQEATDCASLVERAGGRVTVTEGDPRLLKVTTAADLAVVESLLAAR